jgi:hypothetical protein
MRKKRVRSKDVSALMKLLDLLREQGVTPRRTIEAVPTARETLLEKYGCYLREERDLAYGSVRNMTPFVDRFLAQKYPRDHFDFCGSEGRRHHILRSKAGDRTGFGTGETYGFIAPRLFPIPAASWRDRYRSHGLCPLCPGLFVLYNSEISSDGYR